MKRRFLSGSMLDKEHFTFVYLHECSVFAIEQAEASEEGSFYNCMTSIVFSAFCIEAYLNQIGEELIPRWSKLERSPHKKKLNIISQQLNLSLNTSHPPFQSYDTLFGFRNLIAHAKPNEFKKFEGLCTIEQAKKLLKDTEDMVGIIHNKAGLGNYPFLLMGTSGMQKSVRPPDRP